MRAVRRVLRGRSRSALGLVALLVGLGLVGPSCVPEAAAEPSPCGAQFLAVPIGGADVCFASGAGRASFVGGAFFATDEATAVALALSLGASFDGVSPQTSPVPHWRVVAHDVSDFLVPSGVVVVATNGQASARCRGCSRSPGFFAPFATAGPATTGVVR